jgi:hypothetical protein
MREKIIASSTPSTASPKKVKIPTRPRMASAYDDLRMQRQMQEYQKAYLEQDYRAGLDTLWIIGNKFTDYLIDPFHVRFADEMSAYIAPQSKDLQALSGYDCKILHWCLYQLGKQNNLGRKVGNDYTFTNSLSWQRHIEVAMDDMIREFKVQMARRQHTYNVKKALTVISSVPIADTRKDMSGSFAPIIEPDSIISTFGSLRFQFSWAFLNMLNTKEEIGDLYRHSRPFPPGAFTTPVKDPMLTKLVQYFVPLTSRGQSQVRFTSLFRELGIPENLPRQYKFPFLVALARLQRFFDVAVYKKQGYDKLLGYSLCPFDVSKFANSQRMAGFGKEAWDMLESRSLRGMRDLFLCVVRDYRHKRGTMPVG